MGDSADGGHHWTKCPLPSLFKANLSSHPPDIVHGPCWSASLAPCSSLPIPEFSHHPAPFSPTSSPFSPPPPGGSLRREARPHPEEEGTGRSRSGGSTPGPHTQPLSLAGHCPFNRLPLPGALRLGSKFLPVIRSRGEEEEFVNVQFVQRDRCLLASPRPVLCVCECVCAYVGGVSVCERKRECVRV